MFEGEITHTIVMTFKDAEENIRNIKVPFARENVTGKEVRKVMEYIVAAGVFLSHKGLPLVKLVKATLVTVRMIFSAVKGIARPGSAAAAKSAVSEVPAGCPTNEQTAGSDVPPGCPTTSNMSCMLVPRPVGADENNLCTTVTDGVKRKIPNNILMFPCQGDKQGTSALADSASLMQRLRDPRQRVRGAFVPSKGFAAGKSYPIAKEEIHGTTDKGIHAFFGSPGQGKAEPHLSALDGGNLRPALLRLPSSHQGRRQHTFHYARLDGSSLPHVA